MIKTILDVSSIHHNISVNYSKLPDYDEEDNFDWQDIAGFMIEDFADNWKYEKINDSGNRNLCGCSSKRICKKEDFDKNNGYEGRSYIDLLHRWVDYKEAKKLGIIDKKLPIIMENGACQEHDLWNVYTYGRMGATLYWDKYWKGENNGFSFKYEEYELEEMNVYEVKDIYKEINIFNKAVENLMEDFYAECEYRLKEARKEARREAKKEKLYTDTLKVVEKEVFIKRLVGDLL